MCAATKAGMLRRNRTNGNMSAAAIRGGHRGLLSVIQKSGTRHSVSNAGDHRSQNEGETFGLASFRATMEIKSV